MFSDFLNANRAASLERLDNLSLNRSDLLPHPSLMKALDGFYTINTDKNVFELTEKGKDALHEYKFLMANTYK